jgi:hypothetical protein
MAEGIVSPSGTILLPTVPMRAPQGHVVRVNAMDAAYHETRGFKHLSVHVSHPVSAPSEGAVAGGLSGPPSDNLETPSMPPPIPSEPQIPATNTGTASDSGTDPNSSPLTQ